MGAILFFSLGILMLLSIPLITSKFAKRMGRNPKLWFVLGLFLPLIATLILFILPDKSENNQFVD
jgi:Na+/melibiose symporter-like transporter